MLEDIAVDKEEVFEFLDNLRESGVTNMLGSGPYIQIAYGVSKSEAKELFLAWVEQFDEV